MMIKQLDNRCRIFNKVITIKKRYLTGICDKDDYAVGQGSIMADQVNSEDLRLLEDKLK